jgi:hypothetical protein
VQRTRTSSGTSIRQRRLLGLLVAALAAIGGAGCGSAHSPSHIPLSSPSTASTATTSATTPATPPPPTNFLKSEPPITEGTPDSGEWQIGLDRSLVSETPISGTAPTKPTDRLLELRITITYRTPGPPGDFGLATEKFALVEVPQDLGLTHVPSATEQEDAGPESKDIACGATGFAGLCKVLGTDDGSFELYADENGAPRAGRRDLVGRPALPQPGRIRVVLARGPRLREDPVDARRARVRRSAAERTASGSSARRPRRSSVASLLRHASALYKHHSRGRAVGR